MTNHICHLRLKIAKKQKELEKYVFFNYVWVQKITKNLGNRLTTTNVREAEFEDNCKERFGRKMMIMMRREMMLLAKHMNELESSVRPVLHKRGIQVPFEDADDNDYWEGGDIEDDDNFQFPDDSDVEL